MDNHNTIFPNFSWLAVGLSTMRVWHPRGPGQIEVWAWSYLPKNAPDQVKAEMRKMTQRMFSPAGSFETDDGENWTEIQQVLCGHAGSDAPFLIALRPWTAKLTFHARKSMASCTNEPTGARCWPSRRH